MNAPPRNKASKLLVTEIVNAVDNSFELWGRYESPRLSAFRTVRRPAPIPPHQQALRAHLDHRHHQPRLR